VPLLVRHDCALAPPRRTQGGSAMAERRAGAQVMLVRGSAVLIELCDLCVSQSSRTPRLSPRSSSLLTPRCSSQPWRRVFYSCVKAAWGAAYDVTTTAAINRTILINADAAPRTLLLSKIDRSKLATGVPAAEWDISLVAKILQFGKMPANM
jgi:hypothetical protein